jgi:hypothetical protein
VLAWWRTLRTSLKTEIFDLSYDLSSFPDGLNWGERLTRERLAFLDSASFTATVKL